MKDINSPLEIVSDHVDKLETLLQVNPESEKEAARFAADALLPLMEAIRALTDTIEKNVSKSEWPLPDYNDILFKSFQ